jgi:hypothetical protein
MEAQALSTKPHYGAVPRGLHDVKLSVTSSSVQAGMMTAPQQQSSWYKSRVLMILVSVLASAIVIFQVLAISPWYSPPVEANGTPTRSCTLEECGDSRCNATHPYICIDYRQPYSDFFVLGGCKATPWNAVLNCVDSCSQMKCPKATPESTESPVRKCTYDECKYATMCDATHPYVCIGMHPASQPWYLPKSTDVCKATLREVFVHCNDACSITHCSEAFS